MITDVTAQTEIASRLRLGGSLALPKMACILLLLLSTGCADSPNALTAPEPVSEASSPSATPGDRNQGGSVSSNGTANDKHQNTHLRFELATATGLEFQHTAGRSTKKFMPETMGGGVLIADFNRDYAPDVLFINSGEFKDDQTIVPAPHRLFINDGQGNFHDETATWGVTNQGYGMGGAVGDFDNDGYPDVYLTTFDGKDQLLRNTGKRFENVTEEAGLESDNRWSTSAGFFDMENDGDLDLYVVKYVDYDPQLALPCYAQGFLIYCTPVMFEAQGDRLFRNNGDGTFTDVSDEAGIPTSGKGLALAIGDVDQDGDADIYVANDTTSNFLLVNDGQGKFEDQASLLGVGHSNLGKEEAGMGADFSDVNGDGRSDIVCTNFQSETTSVYLQQPQGHFIEQSDRLGVGKVARQRLSFGVDFFDADNDGDEDLLVANGHVDIDVHQYQTGVSFGQQNTLYAHVGGKLIEVTDEAGSALQTRRPSRGLATADLDSDGDLDFIIVNSHDRAEVGINQSEKLGRYLTLWLRGTSSNSSGIGAVVEAQLGETTRTCRVLGASSYLSACAGYCHLGLGDRQAIDRLLIRWPDGAVQEFADVATNKSYELRQGTPLRGIE